MRLKAHLLRVCDLLLARVFKKNAGKARFLFESAKDAFRYFILKGKG